MIKGNALAWSSRMYLHACRRVVLCLIFLPVHGCSAAPGTIGAALGQDRADHRLYVRSTPPGEGAAQAGLAEDDEIIALDGRDVHVMTEEEIRRACRGDVGSAVVVTVLRDGHRKDVTVRRTPIGAKK